MKRNPPRVEHWKVLAPKTHHACLSTLIKINFPHFHFLHHISQTLLTDIETTVNLGRDGTDLRSQILLNHPQRMAIIICDQIHRQSQVTETSRPSNTVQVCFGILGEIKVDDDVHTLNVNTAREEVGRHEVTCTPIAEFMEDAVTVGLLHFSMNVEAGITQLSDFFGEELNAVYRVAENDGLVNFELGE